MANIVLNDLETSRELDGKALTGTKGGYYDDYYYDPYYGSYYDPYGYSDPYYGSSFDTFTTAGYLGVPFTGSTAPGSMDSFWYDWGASDARQDSIIAGIWA